MATGERGALGKKSREVSMGVGGVGLREGLRSESLRRLSVWSMVMAPPTPLGGVVVARETGTRLFGTFTVMCLRLKFLP